MLPAETDRLWDAKNGGWNPEELVIIAGGPSNTSSSIINTFNDIINNRKDIWPDSTKFHSFYLDDVHKGFSPSEIYGIYTYKMWYLPTETLTVGDYTVPEIPKPPDFKIMHHYWKDYIHRADSVMFSGHDFPEMLEVFKTLGPGASYWFNLDDDTNMTKFKFNLMDKTQAAEIWLFKGTKNRSCEEFMNDIEAFCRIAKELGYLKYKAGGWEFWGRYYCQRSDCRECDNVPVEDKRFRGDDPLPGGICPPKKLPIDPRQNIRLRNTLVEENKSTVILENSFDSFITRTFIFETSNNYRNNK